MAPLVALAGFMGSGKSSVGALTARLLGWRFLDLDDEIARSAGMTIAEFFESQGERAFRRRECEVLKELLLRGEQDGSDGEGLVLALGGGTLQEAQTAAMLEERGGVVFLDIDVDTAWERARGCARPLAQDRAAFAALLDTRRPIYERTADWIVPVDDRSAEEIAGEIAGVVRAVGPKWPHTWGVQVVSTERRSTIMGGPGSLVSLEKLAAEATAEGARLFVVTDTNVDQAWGEAVRGLLGQPANGDRTLAVAAGEQTKTVAGLEHCWDWLAFQGARRDDIVVALGGGVVGDLAGFAAATYHRGVGLWQIPTSLLAQVDSSVGGKTAVNLEAGKNLVGAFYQPRAVLADVSTLASLPEREFRSGLAEVAKYALTLDTSLLDLLERDLAAVLARDPGVLEDLVARCVRAKANVVAGDERDTGARLILNYGHTLGHALERLDGFAGRSHGEAISVGMVFAARLSEATGRAPAGLVARHVRLLVSLGLDPVGELPPASEILATMRLDKKYAGGVRFVLLEDVGRPEVVEGLPEELLRATLGEMGAVT